MGEDSPASAGLPFCLCNKVGVDIRCKMVYSNNHGRQYVIVIKKIGDTR